MGAYAEEFPLLSGLGLYAADIRGDGNCLFNALSDQLYGHQDQHPDIRAQVIAYMREHADMFKQFLDVYPGGGMRRNPKRKTTGAYSSPVNLVQPSPEEVDRVFEQHLNTMARGGTWGDNLEIQAFSSAFNTDVKIYQRDFAFMIQANPSSEPRPVAHIAYHTWEHYSSIRNLEGPHTGLPKVQLKALSPEQEQVLKRKLDGPVAVHPWMIDQLQNALPYILARDEAQKTLEECRGSIDAAFEKLLRSDNGGSGSSAQGSSSIERDPDSDDDDVYGPNKRYARHRLGGILRPSRQRKFASSRLARSPTPDMDLAASQSSSYSGQSSGRSSTDVSRSGTQDTAATEEHDTIVLKDDSEPKSSEPPKRRLKLKLNATRAPASHSPAEQRSASPNGVSKINHKSQGPRRMTARDKKDIKKLAQKAARKERQLITLSANGVLTSADKMRSAIALRSKDATSTPPIESGFRTLLI